MHLTINSRKHGSVYFVMSPSGMYAEVRLSAFRYAQICTGGKLFGDPLRVTEETFTKICKKWHSDRLRIIAREEQIDYFPYS